MGLAHLKKWEGNLYVLKNVSIDGTVFIPAAVLKSQMQANNQYIACV